MTNSRLLERRSSRLGELFRFGVAAALNTAFGFGTYAVLVRLGLDPYVAQIGSQILGALFNSRTYAVAFRSQGALGRFMLAYLANYLVNLALLFVFRHLVSSPYLAGLLALLAAATLNFFVLKRFVFSPAEAGA